ncbi:hypothetical protein CP972_13890 [Streptomyces prasinus]|uniref:Uncharacterized protein n=1 Tax=Streptomyces prasinus TaxID=67345 RepID=A0ABX6AXW1_9ACTN|nr:hypothetical protein CP972_13890 [Streptomyces prasinus]
MSGVRCVQLQGGGGRRRGASATDDNAADERAGPHVSGMIRRTDPSPRTMGPGAFRCACGSGEEEPRDGYGACLSGRGIRGFLIPPSSC